jgi:hypothetical protein
MDAKLLQVICLYAKQDGAGDIVDQKLLDHSIVIASNV